MGKRIENPPSAFVLMDSMRNIGYSFTSAVADIIDNSISARATRIDIFVPATPQNIYMAFLDNGNGMDADELRVAMRYGSKGKKAARADIDLGRYGLGLKSASLSQCRRLTVVSKKNGALSAACWDLDEVEETEEWTLIEFDQDEIAALPCLDELTSLSQGTLVIWQDFDVLRQTNDGLEHKGLIDAIDDARDYVSLIFHRYLSKHGLTIAFNGELLEPFDPFLEGHKKTEVGKTSDITVLDKDGIERHISVTPYLLPYYKDLSDEDRNSLGGASRLTAMQGFYVYRNERLIIYGTWFRMSPRSELAKYARIKVDIPTSLDEIWKIDIKKQSAELPPGIKKQLQRCVEEAQISSRRKNKHRLSLREDDLTTIWQKNTDRDGKSIYLINRDAPLIRSLLQQCSNGEMQMMNLLMTAIERSLPFHDMYVDEANANIQAEIGEETKHRIALEAIPLIEMFQQIDGSSFEDALKKILSLEPFRQYEWFEQYVRKECGK